MRRDKQDSYAVLADLKLSISDLSIHAIRVNKNILNIDFYPVYPVSIILIVLDSSIARNFTT